MDSRAAHLKRPHRGLFARRAVRRASVALAVFSSALERALKKQSAAPTAPPCFGRWPRSSPLHRGCFCAVFSDVAAAVRIHPRLWPQRSYIRKTPVDFYTSVFLVGAGGFEPPKLKAADLQSVPIGHSGTRPYSLFAVLRTACIYYHRFSSLSIFFVQIFRFLLCPPLFLRIVLRRGIPFGRGIRGPVISRFTAKAAQESAFLSGFSWSW